MNDLEIIVEKTLKKGKLFKEILSQKPKKADVIVFLQGDRFDRCPKVLSLYQEGFSSKILITGNNTRAEEIKDSLLPEIKEWFLKNQVKEEDIIVEDNSLNTLDQAVNVIKIAKENNYKKLILVTSPYHALRVYLTFLKQEWEGNIVIQTINQKWSDIPSGDNKTALEMLVGEIEKIRNYDLL